MQIRFFLVIAQILILYSLVILIYNIMLLRIFTIVLYCYLLLAISFCIIMNEGYLSATLNIFKAFSTVGIWTLICRLIGFLRDSMITRYLGSGTMADALFMSTKFPSLMRRIFAEGAMVAAFVPIFSRLHNQEGESQVKLFASHVYTLMLCITLAIVLLIEALLPGFAMMIAPGYACDPEKLNILISFMRWGIPFIFFITLSAICGAVLQSMMHFSLPSISLVFGNIFIVISFLFCKHFISDPLTIGQSFVLITTLSALVQLMINKTACRYYGMSIGFTLSGFKEGWSNLKLFIKKVIPVLLGSSFAQVNFLVVIALASTLQSGSATYLSLAEKIAQLPGTTIGVVISAGFLPILSKRISEGNIEKTMRSQKLVFELVFFIAGCTSLLLFFLAYPIVDMLFGYGAFTSESVMNTSMALRISALGMPAIGLIKLFNTAFYSRKVTLLPAVVGVLIVFIDIALSIFLMKFWSYIGLVAASSIAFWMAAITLGICLAVRRYWTYDRDTLSFILRLSTVVIISAILLNYITPIFVSPPNSFAFYKIIRTLSGGAIGGFIFIGLSVLFRVINVKKWKMMNDA